MSAEFSRWKYAREGRWIGRGPRTYRRLFGYGNGNEQLEGKRILDLGAGDSTFATSVRGVADVVRLDPNYFERVPEDAQRVVAGIGQALPFPTGFFDESITSFTIFHMPYGGLTLSEMLRVTRVGGTAKVNPIFSGRRRFYQSPESLNVRIYRPSWRDHLTLEIDLLDDSVHQDMALRDLYVRQLAYGLDFYPDLRTTVANVHRLVYANVFRGKARK